MRVLVWGEPPDVPRGLWAYRLGRDASLLGGAFSEGGILLEWAQKTLQAPSLENLDDELAELKPDAHGLTVLPFLAGERATGWSTRATGVFEGIRMSTTPLEMVQAMMESVSLRFAQVAELLPGKESLYVASGGAVRNSTWWLQAMADALGAPVQLNHEDQETSRGAAVLALHGLGEWESLDDHMPHVKKTFKPRPEVTDVYQKAVERQKALYKRVLG
jgi:gluconokinase